MITLGLVLLVIVLTATATVCLSAVFTLAIVILVYANNRAHHRTLLERGWKVTPQTAPGLSRFVRRHRAKLQVKAVDLFVVPSRAWNAYTFGLVAPKSVVLNAPLLKALDGDELSFILGHELGHVRLGHTWLNSLVGGMAGIPSPFAASAILAMAFLWWNRACEFSADRAGLLACGKPTKAISALVKLAAGRRLRSRGELERVIAMIEAEDDRLINNLGEALGTHPMTVKRIERLRRYAASPQYRRLQALIDGNVTQQPKVHLDRPDTA